MNFSDPLHPGFAPSQRHSPLSSAQHRLWFLERVDTGVRDTYHLSGAWEFTGPFDEKALRRTLDAVLGRHDVLRATFQEIGGEPTQCIADHAQIALQVVDLSHLPAEALAAERERQVAEEARAPFDLRRGPLIRGRLLRLAPERHTVVLTMHHIVSDGASIAVMLREAVALYAAFCENRPDPLPPLAAAYQDHVALEHERAGSPGRRARIDYWRRQLAGAPALLELPADRPRPARQSHAGDHVAVPVSAELTAALRAWARRHGATLPMALHAGLAVLLSRLSGQHDIVIGTPVANRRRPAFRELMGFFVNTLALRVDLADNPSARALLDRVRATAQAAYLRQDVPFEQVVEALQPERDASHSPVFQVMLVMHNFDTPPMALPHGSVQLVEVPPLGVAFDLSVSMRETADGLLGRFAYATSLFDRATVQRWGRYFVRVLEAMVRDDAQRVADLPLIDDAERTLLLERFNAAPAAEAPAALVHTLFEEQAARSPDATALVAAGRHWRYAELDRAADRLAHRLRGHGVGPDARVALFVQRGADMVVGVLAALKAGGCYLPLDPADPPERIAGMLADAAPRVVLTHAALQAALPASSAQVLVLDAAGAADDAALPVPARAAPAATPQHLAYVIYTSGSTGVPKGVAMPHAPLANLIRWQCRQGPAARTLQFAAIGFDVAFQEMFSTLCAGGTLVIADETARRDPEALAQLLQAEAIERLFLPFIALEHLAQWLARQPKAVALPALRQVITAGEQLRIGAELRRLFAALPGCRLHNHYGPTETHVVTAEVLEADPAAWPVLPPIGRPVDGARLYVLDAQGQPAPLGVAGELHVGGVAVARGYLERPDLTAERFEPDPFGHHADARRYKTGDLARWLPDGLLDYLGRNDRQVKVRGFRIEPAEIEARLADHPQVRDAAVVLRAQRLVAYVVAQDAAAPPPDEAGLRHYLKQWLPAHMLPARCVWLDALPLTASGKVDREALPEPNDGDAVRAERVMPRDATEQALWEIWSEVLASAAFGVDDSFFELGGHSLMTTQVASRIRQRLGAVLPLQVLFDCPTIATLAQAVVQALGGRAGDAGPPMPRVPRGGPMPVSLSQRRMWVIQQFDPASVAYNVAFSMRLTGPLDADLVQRAFDLLVARHEGLRTCFRMHGTEPAQFIEPALPQTIERIDLRTLPPADRAAAARALLRDRSAVPFDLTQAPLHRATLVQLGDDDHALLWLMHHAISDNWSLAVLMREVLVLYAALRRGEAPALEPLAIEYADYAAWQRSPAVLAGRRHQLAYWVERLRGLQRLNLPTDFARPAHPSFRGASVSADLPLPLREALRGFCGRHRATPFFVLLAAFKLMLSRQSGSSDIAVGTPVANRHHLATEQLVGTLVNTLVMRTDLAGDPDFTQLVERVRSTALAAFEHQDAPFDELVEALGQDRVAQPEGLVRVLFNVLNAPLGRHAPVDFGYETFDLDRTAAQFDLSVHVDTGFSHRIHLEYATDLYAPATARRLLENYLALVTQVLAQPALPLSRFGMLAPAQLALLRDDWNGTARALPPDLLVHRHLRTADASLRDRVAVVDATGRDMRYGDLESRANALARALRALGVGRGHRVGLCVARDAGMLVAQLGVLKSGAAYVPLDPSFPVDRLSYMADDAALTAILVPAALAAPFATTGVALLDPADPALTAQHTGDALPPDAERDAQPLDPAYLIYTSGSTGRPKGVAVPHRAVVNFLAAMARAPGLDAGDRLVAVTTLSFDIAVLELLLPLAVGAQVIVASHEQVANPAQLLALLAQHDATVMQATPSAWRALLDAGWTGASGRFRALVGGEPLPPALAEPLLARCAALWNMYGPTETTVWSTCWQVHSPRDGISIGRPIDNTSVWILDAAGHPCPIGVPGEACIGGLGVALGYHGREALTAERFVPDRWSHEPGARLYRTGDLVRWRQDGWLEHLGRIDHQVKVRGYRIELGEIESVLSDHPGISNCVVVTRAEREDDVRLVAYYVVRSAGVDAGALREHLRARLPDYMVPQHFMGMPALPQLPNGKIDRAALPAPVHEALPGRTPVKRQPLTPQEQTMADIWAELLGTDDITRTDNFFDLGGHSLLAMRAVTAIYERLGWTVAPRRFVFETLGQLARESNLTADRANG